MSREGRGSLRRYGRGNGIINLLTRCPFAFPRVTGSDRVLRGLWTPRWTPVCGVGHESGHAPVVVLMSDTRRGTSSVRWKLLAPQSSMSFEDGEDFNHLPSRTVDDSVFLHDQFPKTASRHFWESASAVRVASQSIGGCDQLIDELRGGAGRVLRNERLDLQEPLPCLSSPDDPLHPTRSARQA